MLAGWCDLQVGSSADDDRFHPARPQCRFEQTIEVRGYEDSCQPSGRELRKRFVRRARFLAAEIFCQVRATILGLWCDQFQDARITEVIAVGFVQPRLEFFVWWS